MKEFSFHQPSKIVFGIGKTKGLKNYIPRHIKRVIIVTDKNIMEKSLLIKEMINELEGIFKVCIFSDIEENPSFETVDRGSVFARSGSCELVIGIGGGSPMDAAKGIAVIADNPGSIEEYVKGKKLIKPPLPIICIPTTSGTGSEVTPFAVFTDKKDQNKCGFSHKDISPFLSIIDPELTYSMPGNVIINTGLDVLSHAVEAYFSKLSFHHNDMHALEAIRLVFKYLVSAAEKKENAMGFMSYASLLSGIAISHASTILPHIMGYPLTIFHSIPHGLASFLTIPAFLRYLQKNRLEDKKLKELGNLIGGIDQFDDLAHDLNISLRLSSYGIKESEFIFFAEKTIKKGDVRITPGDIKKEDIINIYKDSL